MAPISHLHSETKVLPLSMHLKLGGEQFYASALQTAHPSHECVTHPIGDRLMKHSLRSRFSEDVRRILGQNIRRPAPMFGGILRAGSYGVAKTRLKTDAVHATLRAAPPPPPTKSFWALPPKWTRLRECFLDLTAVHSPN